MAYFTDWSLCLMCVSAGSGVLVSLKYLLTSYHTSKVIVHGRPGLTPRHRESQYACGCPASASAASTSDLENMLPPDQVGLTDRLTDRRTSSQPLVDTSWEIDNTSLENSASTSRDAVSPRGHAVSQLASASISSLTSESGYVQPKRLCRTPSDLESMAPAELLYDPQVAFLPIQLLSGLCMYACAAYKCGCSAVLCWTCCAVLCGLQVQLHHALVTFIISLKPTCPNFDSLVTFKAFVTVLS